MAPLFFAFCLLFNTPLLALAEFRIELADVLELLLHKAKHPEYGLPPTKETSHSSKASGSGSRFAIEVDAADWDKVLSLAESAGFVIEKKLQSFSNIYIARRRGRRKRDTGQIISELISSKSVRWAEPLLPLYREKRVIFTDPLYKEQLRSWSSTPSMSIPEAWAAGFTGKGVTVAVLDDGVDALHEDLQEAVDPELCYNFIEVSADVTPKPGREETHGTRCAGIIAMTANNSKCGVGVAHRSKLAGLKVLGEGQLLNDAIEGDSLAYKSDRIDIYSVSWGPRDDGRSAEKPGSLAQKALEYGTMHGRGGLGSLYVWASGNGGLEDDNCAMDGYASNLHTITLGVATSTGAPPWYAEGCSAVMAAVTEGPKTTNGMITTDVDNKCVSFSGSSAAAPLGAAILALVLEANPLLSQRDVQHLIVRTSESETLVRTSPSQWIVNGAGLPFSRYFGFGVLNAEKLTKAAKQWKRVEPVSSCAREMRVSNGTFKPGSPLRLDLPFEGCKGTSGEVNWLERVQITITIEHPRRGQIALFLTSPSGTTIQLLHPRKNDDSPDGLSDWPFVSVGHWGENPQGKWRLEAVSVAHPKNVNSVGSLKAVRLTVQGTRADPLKNNAFILSKH
ncbi:hypothetical protein Y032_0001g346 [Ancylostoma ceylanicum]|uniref:P/Homo B domain-containing protein n=2 Tax=Ancylostoma ceylanicum TaxID=53326 RepID=A0A016W3S4_9BILA|nr:hypothetical protein Y032_0001g346 [Ancylostoma ceylanicum]